MKQIIHSNRLDAAYYEKFKKDYDQVDLLLRELPSKLTYNVMIPLNSVAFMMGHLEHTNEIMVFLGNDYFVKTTAKQAQVILSRRRDFVTNKLKACEDLYLELKSKVGLVSEVLGVEEGFSDQIEIKERIDEPIDLILPSGSRLGTDELNLSLHEKGKEFQAPKIEVISQEEMTCEADMSTVDKQGTYNDNLLEVLMKMEEAGIKASNMEIQQALSIKRHVDKEAPNKGGLQVAAKQELDKEANTESLTISDGRDVVKMLESIDCHHVNIVDEEDRPKKVSRFKADRHSEKRKK